MRVGIVGSGNIGGTLARLVAAAGHDVAIANSRGAGSLAAFAAELGSARAETVAGAARGGDVVVVAVPYHVALAFPPEPFQGKVVVDANNYFGRRDGPIDALERGASTSSELLAEHLGTVRLVKAFNTIHHASLAADGRPDAAREQRLAIPLAGDDAAGKALVSGLIEEIGFAALDTGGLDGGGRLQQPGAAFFNRPLRLPEAERELAALRGG